MDLANFFRSHPPRCLGGFVVQNTELNDVVFDGHYSGAPGELNPIFALSCRCGSNQHYVHCWRWANPWFHNKVVTLSPIALECAACSLTAPLLDTDIHGYNSELNLGSSTVRAGGDQAVFECPACGKQPLQTFARFEYPDDLLEEDDPEFAGREQELFSWFTLIGQCPKCQQKMTVADFECA